MEGVTREDRRSLLCADSHFVPELSTRLIHRGTVVAKAAFSIHALGLIGRFAFRVLGVGHR